MTSNDIEFITNQAAEPKTRLQWLFAHGAGAPMDSDFMNLVAEGVAEAGITVQRFEFPYMQERRTTGKKRPPNRAPILLDHFQQAIEQVGGAEACIIGGKSMGGRMASVLAADDSLGIQGVVCLGYPFYPVGKKEKTRIDHFPDMKVAHCILQGTRDALGEQEDVLSYQLPDVVGVHWFDDGNHDLKPRKKSGFSHEEHIEKAIQQIAAFILSYD
ncbi:hypothetical protein A9Q99_16690 [Gammaproteobacteria bacterium 45_16_T64]|nr:hypothetical protein A9Q99_16690 [Gammaproteobacteria bacterium 45_16_T64]